MARAAVSAPCSPRAWGWTARMSRSVSPNPVFPTRVGVDRPLACGEARLRRVPHARGGGPVVGRRTRRATRCSPRAWGWTAVPLADRRRRGVFPTRVGVDRDDGAGCTGVECVPHARGGGPKAIEKALVAQACSPRAWGWTDAMAERAAKLDVFPTRVGVDRRLARGAARAPGVPHARGGGPAARVTTEPTWTCSPRAWGWTDLSEHVNPDLEVFPTRVGVDRTERGWLAPFRGVPHARGGGPPASKPSWRVEKCSPRAWGWTEAVEIGLQVPEVFPTRVGVDRSPAASHRC